MSNHTRTRDDQDRPDGTARPDDNAQQRDPGFAGDRASDGDSVAELERHDPQRHNGFREHDERLVGDGPTTTAVGDEPDSEVEWVAADEHDRADRDEVADRRDGDESGLLPGAVAARPVTALWPDQTIDDLRNRWQAAQLRFVDEPRAAATEMRALVSAAVQTLSTALASRQQDLDGWDQDGDSDTEELRIAVQRYRDFFNLVLGH